MDNNVNWTFFSWDDETFPCVLQICNPDFSLKVNLYNSFKIAHNNSKLIYWTYTSMKIPVKFQA